MGGVAIKQEVRGINPPQSIYHEAFNSELKKKLLDKYLEIDKILHVDSVNGNSFLSLIDRANEFLELGSELENELLQELINRVDSYLIQKENELKFDNGRYLDPNKKKWVKSEKQNLDLKVDLLL